MYAGNTPHLFRSDLDTPNSSPMHRSPSRATSASATSTIDLTHTDLGRRTVRPKLVKLARHKLRKLAIEQSCDERAYFRHDATPHYRPLSVPAKGTVVIETIAPYRQGTFIKQVPEGRFDRVLVHWEQARMPEISSLYLLQLQVEQLTLFS